MAFGLLQGEDRSFRDLHAGESFMVDGHTFTLCGITIQSPNREPWVQQLRYHSTENGGDKNYCFLDTWKRWRETGTWYRLGSQHCKKQLTASPA
jgi:hypothetical protein